MYLELMTPGRAQLVNALNATTKPKITKFEVGATANFVPNKNGTGVTPSVLYSGTVENIRKTIVNENELILTVVLPNDLAFPPFGNIMLKTNDNVPFLWFVLRAQHGKNAIDGAKHYAGDLQFQSMIIKIPQIVNRLDLSQNPNFYSQPAFYDDMDDLPEPLLAPTTEVVVRNNDYKFNGERPIQAYRVRNQWWGVPGMKSIDDENFGNFDGGVVGDNYGAI